MQAVDIRAILPGFEKRQMCANQTEKEKSIDEGENAW